MRDTNILVWLPSPMGDAILATPALRAIRKKFESSRISFFGNPVVREVLSDGGFNNQWLNHKSKNPFAIARLLKGHNFSQAILFKNSFGSAVACFLAGVPVRIGYSREARGFLLTDKLHPARSANGKFKPESMIDYYLAIAAWLGCDTNDRNMELAINEQASENIKSKLPQVSRGQKPVVILVPGGAYGPSKCWPSDRFAETADWLIDKYDANIVISVAQLPPEKKIANQICDLSTNELINLGEKPLSLSELKALFSIADLVITNDTGPRHIAIALKRKVITLFGPNDPAWTETGWQDEIKIVGKGECVPCRKPVCEKNEHLCMESISVEAVCEAAKELIKKQ